MLATDKSTITGTRAAAGGVWGSAPSARADCTPAGLQSSRSEMGGAGGGRGSIPRGTGRPVEFRSALLVLEGCSYGGGG